MYLDNYKRWLAADLEDPALTEELKRIEGNDDEIKDRFAVSLQFGTAGLRGVLGAGSNRMFGECQAKPQCCSALFGA